jgi:hypothetical protein
MEVIRIGEQKVPDDIGKEVGVAADLRRGRPKPREVRSQAFQYTTASQPDGNKAVKLQMSDKVREED